MQFKTNSEAINHYINFGSALNQVFLIDAVLKVSREVIKSKDEVKELMKGSFIHPDAWINCAEQAIKLLDFTQLENEQNNNDRQLELSLK
tara:strand:+ start:314 stop:583 length:270 start_codon:yes stop_codon:yes gene_type:complete